ncbi:hypothetical protein L9F63_025888, partial [Diploptera punctata]
YKHTTYTYIRALHQPIHTEKKKLNKRYVHRKKHRSNQLMLEKKKTKNSC